MSSRPPISCDRSFDSSLRSPYSSQGLISYLLRDEFTTTRAAGAVNGTAAEPGPGTRVVVDAGSDLSIAGSQLVFSGGTGSYGDPGYWLGPTVSRVAGSKVLP